MAFKDIFQYLVPKDKTFFPLFEQASTYLVELSNTLHEAVNVKGDREEYYSKIKDLVANIESLTHKMNIELSKNFITPFDREDIHALITSINDVANNIYNASNRMKLYQVDKITKSIRKLTELNLEACQQISLGVHELKDLKHFKNINTAVKKINKIEEKGDEVFDRAVADLFLNESDVKSIIIYKEVLIALHNSTDKCRIVARTLESIAVKHS